MPPAVAVDEAACAAAELRLEEESYMVDNSALKSRSTGIRYRLSPALEDTDKRQGLGLARFGDIVEGVSFPDGWLMLGRRRFLPKRVNDHIVLVRLGGSGDGQDSGHDRVPAAPEVRPDDAAADSAPAQGDEGQGDANERSDVADAFALQQAVLKKHDPLFELVGAEITSRQVLEENLMQLRTLLGDKDLDIDFRGTDGNTPLMLATIRGHLDYCVVLAEAGAETMMPVLSSPNGRLAGLARWGPAKALIEALTVGHTSSKEGDLHMAMEKLQPEVKTVASLLIRRAKAKALDMAEEQFQAEDHGLQNGRQPGMPYKVVYKEVPVFERPTNGGEDEVAFQEGGDIVEVYEFDRTRNWGRVRVDAPNGEEIWGWMPLQNDVLGELLVPL